MGKVKVKAKRRLFQRTSIRMAPHGHLRAGRTLRQSLAEEPQMADFLPKKCIVQRGIG
jgi:hypothetical protein